MNSAARITLARAYATTALLVFTLAAAMMLWPSGTSAVAKVTFHNAAMLLRGVSLAYLLMTAIALCQRQTRLRALDLPSPQLNLLAMLGHFWVLWVSSAATLRRTASRTLLAGCDPVLAALVAASTVCLVLLVFEWWQQRRQRLAKTAESASGAPRIWSEWLSGTAAWLVVLVLWYVETLPLH